jgi:hypothetical protein
MDNFDLEQYLSRSRALELSDLPWADIPSHALPDGAIRCLRYMQDIESHTIIYLRTLLSTRAIDDPEVAAFLACWLYEESFHGRALAQFLVCAGATPVERLRSRAPFGQRLEAVATSWIARAWPDFVAVHMTWGAINELTTLTGYRRLIAVSGHPVLTELLSRIVRDESRHFFFYFRQAERRLATPATARITRYLIQRFWAPVGTGVQPKEETRFLARYLFSGSAGRAAAERVDATIRALPGLAGVPLLEAWIDACGTDAGNSTTPAADRDAAGAMLASHADPAGSAASVASSSRSIR